jgi:hypothetical protein
MQHALLLLLVFVLQVLSPQTTYTTALNLFDVTKCKQNNAARPAPSIGFRVAGVKPTNHIHHDLESV